MLAGISGATAGSGGVEGADEKDGRLMPPPHAPSNIVSAEAIPRLATARALSNLTMAFPRAKFVAAPVPQPSVKLLSGQ
jgi:hypothetical protein